jgi:RimJ/RimL family protein N-acetyltransferase
MTLLDHAIAKPDSIGRRLTTERLLLRAPQPSDAEAVVALLKDRRIAENSVRIPHPYSLADAQAFIGSANTTEGETVFVITRKSVGVIGACGIARLSFAGPELGYWIGSQFWGLGYATEAARAVIEHAFAELGHELLFAGARVSNPASRRVLEKCGFKWTGVALARIRTLSISVPVDRYRLEAPRCAAPADLMQFK